MRIINVELLPSQDMTAILASACWPMGSLRAPRELWGAVLRSMGMPIYPYLQGTVLLLEPEEAAYALVVSAVPMEGVNGPPYRAAYRVTEDAIIFETPGSVEVAVRRAAAGVDLVIDFRRESRHLATLIASRLFAEGVPGAAGLLEMTAREARVAEDAAGGHTPYGADGDADALRAAAVQDAGNPGRWLVLADRLEELGDGPGAEDARNVAFSLAKFVRCPPAGVTAIRPRAMRSGVSAQ